MGAAAWVYTFCLAFGVILAFVSGFFGMVFGGHGDVGGGGVDVHTGGVDVHTGPDVHAGGVDVHGGVQAANTLGPTSAPIISTLMGGFGGVGLFCTAGLHLPPLFSVPIALGSAVGLAAIAFFALSKFLLSIQGTSHSTLASLVGTEAQVTTPIAADGVGEVAYSHAGVRESGLARSEDGVMIPRHSMVRVTRVAGSTLIVRELVDERLRRLKESEEGEEAEPEK